MTTRTFCERIGPITAALLIAACESAAPVVDRGDEVDAGPRDVPSVVDAPAVDVPALRDVPVVDVPAARDVPVVDVPAPRDVTTPRDVPVASDVTSDVAAPGDVAGGCGVRVEGTESPAGQVGGNGGGPSMDLVCPAGQVAIGVAVRVSDGGTAAGGMRSAVGLTILCATVRLAGGVAAVGPETEVESQGDGRFGWTPATQTAPARCPPGWVVSGLRASRGVGGERFVDVTVTCAELGGDGAPTGMSRALYVEGSLREEPVYDTAACPAGQALRRVGTRTGAGFDAAALFCAAPTCTP
jgi:hypothetical protein